MNRKYSHTTTTTSAPGQKVNTRKMKASTKIVELSMLMPNALPRGGMLKRFLSRSLPKAHNARLLAAETK
jgi:hypothetical protein